MSGASNKIQTKLACILEADESTRMRMRFRYRIIMKTILQEKLKIHYSTIIWFTSLFLCLKLRKFRQRKQRWTRNGKNWRKFRRGTSQVKSKKQVIDEARTAGATVHFASLMDISSEKYWIGGKAPKIQRSSCTPRWHCKRRFWLLCSIHWTRIFSISNDSS